ncbi:MAG TPA: transglycosylase SLT domain-containing protein [Verrucomicrobiae bacterium]|nr:transglycosylase SLT domain-containing protein [Verrucomicrobiae bacterium]
MHRIRPLLSVFCAGLGAFGLTSAVHAADWANIQDLASQVSSTTVVATTTLGIVPVAQPLAVATSTPVAVPVSAQVPAPVPVASVTSTVVLKMADGTFYHPSSGKKASSLDALCVLLGVPSGYFDEASATPPAPQEPQTPAILQAVYRAQQELRDRLKASGDDKIKNVKPVSQSASRDITLAIWNRVTDEIVYVDAVKKGTDLDLDDNAPVNVKVKLANYINSDYATDDPDHVVVAVRYPIYHDVYKGRKIVSDDLEQAVYTPASAALLTPDVVAAGEQMLDADIADAITGLHKEKTVSPELIKSIAIVEHSDLGTLKSNPKAAASKVFATVALNPTNPYAYARSPAGALGLFQFIPSTYKNLAKRTALGLNPDFEDGMADPKNASKAAVGYMDAILGSLPAEAKNDPMSPRAFEFFAAGYNGGTAKLARASLIWDDQISGALTRGQILSRARLQPETIDYVRKLRALLPVIMSGDVTLPERTSST